MQGIDKALEKLTEQLEDKPDEWFNNPRGYLKKPDYKREQQTVEYIASGRDMGIFSRLTAAAFKNRYFVLYSNDKKLRYFENAEMKDIKGTIDLLSIDRVDYSHVRDAGPFSIDLISRDIHYTLQAENRDTMHKWALAIKRCLRKHKLDTHSAAVDTVKTAPSYTRDSLHGRPEVLQDVEKWHRYDFTYEEPGPMYMNVMGSSNRDTAGNELNAFVIVTAFELMPDGSPGRSEASGVISVRDYVVGVNGVDLTTSTFNEAMELIGQASFPKTLHFLRDNDATKEQTRIESWAVVYYPALNRRRRRYIEVKANILNLRKPAPGGSACAERDAFFLIDHIDTVSPIIDMNVTPDQRYVLQLHCKEKSTIEHIGAGDKSVGGSPVSVVELCFPAEKIMNQWRSLLCSPTIFNNNEGIHVNSVRTVEVGEDLEHSSAATENKDHGSVLLSRDDLAIRSTLTGNITSRRFRVMGSGHVEWERKNEDHKIGAASMTRRIFIADGTTCDLVRVQAMETPLGRIGNTEYKYQLGLETKQSSLLVCFADKADLMQYLEVIRSIVSKAPKATIPNSLSFPDSIEVGGVTGEGGEAFDVYGSSHNNDGELDTFQGYLYKRNDLLLPKGFSPQAGFIKVYVILRQGFLFLYHTQIETTSGVPPFQTVSIAEVIQVHEATDAGMPENAFEVVTVEKVFTFCATDEDSLILWIEAFSDLLEARDGILQKVTGHVQDNGNVRQDAYVEAIKKSIVFSGGITMKSVNLYTGLVTWRDRFVVITRSALSYYDDAKDVYNPDATSINDVGLANVMNIETCNHERETRCAPLCAFEVTAFVTKGGDEDGTRVFVFETRTPELCKQWMEALCEATGKFELAKHRAIAFDGFYQSVESSSRLKDMEERRLGAYAPANAGAGTALSRPAKGRGAARAGRGFVRRASTMPVKSETEATEGEAAASEEQEGEKEDREAPRAAPEAPAMGGGARGGAGRGGAGRSAGRGGAGRGRGFTAPHRKAAPPTATGI
eukprot:GSChrysophyteH1.ASY1.ANO1.813.1 assembled CDS